MIYNHITIKKFGHTKWDKLDHCYTIDGTILGLDFEGSFRTVIRDSLGNVLSIFYDRIIRYGSPYLTKLLRCCRTLQYIEENFQRPRIMEVDVQSVDNWEG